MIYFTRKIRRRWSRSLTHSLFMALFLLSIPLKLVYGQSQQQDHQIGFRSAYFVTQGELSEVLPTGYGIQLYSNHPLSSISRPLANFLTTAKLQFALNYESLSNEVDEVRGVPRKVEYNLERLGLEAGPVWLFSLDKSHHVSVTFLAGLAYEFGTSKKIDEDGNTPPPDEVEVSGFAFSSHLLFNYEYHYSNFIFSAGSYRVYGAAEKNTSDWGGF